MLEEVLSKEALHGVAVVGRKDTEGMEDMVGIDGTVMGTGEAIAIPRATIISIVSFPVICHTYSTAPSITVTTAYADRFSPSRKLSFI